MRVLIDYRPALRERTGAGEYLHQAALALGRLASADHPDPAARDLQLFLFSSSWKDRLPGPVEGAALVDRRVPVRILNFAWHRLEWPPVEWLAGEAFDVVHSGHPLLMPARNAARVVTVHDLDFLTAPERTVREIRRDYPVLAGRHARRADRVVVPSHYTAGEVERRLEVPRGQIAVCPPGAPAWQPRPGRPEQGYILFLGSIEPRKNLLTLLDAYAALAARRPDAPPLRLAGPVRPDGRDVLNRLTAPPLGGRARHLGYVAADAKRRLFDEAVAFVMPSLDEGFGMPLLEAMAAGVPVIASNRGALPEVAGGAALLVEPTDVRGWTDALDAVTRDRALADRLALAGVARAGAYRWEATARALVRTYRDARMARLQHGAPCG